MENNGLLHGFRILKKTFVPEADSEVWEMQHEKSGARLIFMENKDDNKVFSIAFRTPPADDTGVAHIIEHSVLCGSRKYPLKEPFVELVKGSLNTFLNAMTYPDKTMYPVASRNDKDFQNLMDVYLDAVFYPAIYDTDMVLLQEGWHYEIAEPEAPLVYSGVVYNEMKGALSSPEALLASEQLRALYPDTTYARESGGDPLYIPELTQEKFLDFHRRYYHPSNSYIFLYGDMDIEEKLEYLDREYLSHFSAIGIDSRILPQKPFTEMRRVEKAYQIGAEESAEGKTFLNLSIAMPEKLSRVKMRGMVLLWRALLGVEGAPLRQAVIDAGIGRDVALDIEVSLCQPCFSITVQNAEADQADKFYQVVEESLQRFVRDGLDKELLQGVFNRGEFSLREADTGMTPKGLFYNIEVMTTWLYDRDPLEVLYYEEALKTLQAEIDSGKLEGLLDELVLKNPHKILLVMKPDKELAAKREKEQAEKQAALKAQMSPAEIEGIIKKTAALKKRQQTEDSPEALATIPVLEISDIKKQPEKLPLEERQLDGVKVLFSDINTSGICYLRLYFDASRIPQDKLMYAWLLVDLIGAVSTEKHSFREVSTLVNMHTGGLGYELVPLARRACPDYYDPRFIVQAKVLVKKLPQAMALLQEILTGSIFTEEKRMKELVAQIRSNLELTVLRDSYHCMNSRLQSYITPAGRYAEQGGLEYGRFMRELDDDFAPRFAALAAELKKLLPVVFNRNRLVAGVTLAEKEYKCFADSFLPLLAGISSAEYPAAEYHWEVRADNEGLAASSQVQYVGKGANFIKLGYSYTGAMRVLETIMRYDYLWTRIRVQGGAYGAFTVFTNAGNMSFGSYRDPNLRETLDVFDSVAEYLKGFDCSEREMTKFIIGTMSSIDAPLTPRMIGRFAADNYFRNVSYEDRLKTRTEILSTRQPEIRALAGVIADCMKENRFCVFGNEAKLKENGELFGKIINVIG